MKKLWLVLAAVALVGWTVSTFADVQNIRLSGDIRVRGYYLNNVAGDNEVDDTFISQRTRVTVEADLEDHVLVVATLKAEGLWGKDDEPNRSSGAGSDESDGAINRRFDLGVSEAYVQLNEIFFSPITLKLGRQYLHYGRGLIISSVEQEYNFDAARFVWDAYPFVMDVLYASIEENSFFGPGDAVNDVHMLFANARLELSDSILKDIEFYGGYVINSAVEDVSRANPTIGGASPFIVGARVDVTPADVVNLWLEGAYEFGPDGFLADEYIEAFLVNAGARIGLGDSAWGPALNLNYTFASGGGSDFKNTFRPWFDYVDGYNGYVFHPLLANLHILNAGLSLKPYENTTLSFQAYYYYKADADGVLSSNSNVDYGFTGITSVGDSGRDVGWEIDGILGYDYSKDVRCQLVYGVFIPERAVHNSTSFDAVAHEVRGEVNVKF